MKAQFSFRSQSLITRTALFGLAFLGGTLAVGTSPLPGSAHSAFCPTIGLLLATLLIFPRREWPFFFVATAPAIIASIFTEATTPDVTLLLWAVHHAQALAGAFLVQSLGTHRPRLESLQDVIEFTVVGGVIATVFGATLSSIVGAQFFPAESINALWKSWASSHLVGTMTIAPLLLTWDTERITEFFSIQPKRLTEALLLTLSAGVWGVVIFSGLLGWSRMDEFLILPLIMWAPARFGMRGAAWINILIAILANILAMYGYGEYARAGVFEYRTLLGLQMLLAVTTLSTLALGAVLGERERALERLEGALAEKELLHREIHHRVKNNLNLVASLLNVQTEYVRDPNTIAILEDARHRVIAMAKIHERLTGRRDVSTVDFGEYLTLLGEDFRNSLTRTDISIVVRTASVELDVERAVSCGLIVNELTTNALTHAFPNGKGGEINIILSLVNTKHLRLIVSDNGIGLPADLKFTSSSSMGMMVVQSLTRQLGATVDISSQKGTTFTIDFPA
jgi:two-component sensor histidine kinase/integral membrane sensor domain MASE1